MSKVEFEKLVFSLSKDASSSNFTRADIVNKIAMLHGAKPSVNQKKELSKWQRVHDRFELLSYQGTEILYLKRR